MTIWVCPTCGHKLTGTDLTTGGIIGYLPPDDMRIETLGQCPKCKQTIIATFTIEHTQLVEKVTRN